MSQSVVVASTRATATTWACGTRISVEISIHARRVWCQSILESPRSVIESRFVDDDIGGNWSSKCSCQKYLESVSVPPVVRELYITLLEEDVTLQLREK